MLLNGQMMAGLHVVECSEECFGVLTRRKASWVEGLHRFREVTSHTPMGGSSQGCPLSFTLTSLSLFFLNREAFVLFMFLNANS